MPAAGSVVVRLADRRGAAPVTMNRRVASVRGLFEYAVLTGARPDNPVPAARRATGFRAARRGLLGHLGPGRPRSGGRLVRQPRRLPESLGPAEVARFVADLLSARDRAMALAMLLGGLRAGEVRGLRLADVDQGLRRLRIVGKGGRERVVPVERAFFTELAIYLRTERPVGCPTPECFVVLRGPTAGGWLSDAGLRRIFRTHPGPGGHPAGHAGEGVRRAHTRPGRKPSFARWNERSPRSQSGTAGGQERARVVRRSAGQRLQPSPRARVAGLQLTPRIRLAVSRDHLRRGRVVVSGAETVGIPVGGVLAGPADSGVGHRGERRRPAPARAAAPAPARPARAGALTGDVDEGDDEHHKQEDHRGAGRAAATLAILGR